MREHMGLFRGKRWDGAWVYGYLYAKPILEKYFIISDENQWLIDRETVGECTGLEDKNGKLIFEGDIIEQVYLGVKHRFTIVYSQEAFAWGQKNNNGLTGRLAKGIGTLEIIGNIHDNPELLEGAGDDA